MARTPENVNISLHDLMLLLNYRWAATCSEIGDLGVKCYEDLLGDIGIQSEIRIRPDQLADLIHHMKEVTFERVEPAKLMFTHKNHNKLMRRLKSQMPSLFKETSAGEVVMVDYEDRFV